MTKKETQASLLSARFKALAAHYAATRQLEESRRELEQLDAALTAMKDLVDATVPTAEKQG